MRSRLDTACLTGDRRELDTYLKAEVTFAAAGKHEPQGAPCSRSSTRRR
jgi:hypothetical protein